MKARQAFVALLTAGVVGSTVWLVFFSPVLGVRSVEIVGNLTVPADQIEKQAGVAPLHPLATVDLGEVEGRVLAIRRLASARVERAWPSTLKIEVVERQPVAVVPVGDKAALIDRKGVVTEVRPSAPPELPVLRVDRPGPGDPATVAAIKVIGGLPEALLMKIDEVRATSPEGISFRLTNGRTVIWGGADRGEDKARVLEALLPRTARVYDVSSPDVVSMK
ncbi:MULTISPECIES: FtsQ-type POTRA domain-containing protein [Nonomuraea]|uniref:Cell division protein FtsQ n=2 Tax=Nonomuraea TaxID=83681 RepID=A0A7W5YU30_9ACTN|nr:FtsQ-type POTRA domain-containing protein [Nonomuraea dietziae]MBB3732219.1 cell division protein FtsQ [Nonomuraea dietziae]